MGFELEIQEPKRFKAPTLEEVRLYCQQRGNQIDPEAFVDYYKSVGWHVGPKKKMVDWQACVRTWEKKQRQAQPQQVRTQKIHQAKPDRKLTQEQRQNRRSDIDQLKRLARGIKV